MKRKAKIAQGAALNTPDEELDMLALLSFRWAFSRSIRLG